MSFTIIIPARFSSSRLPGKPLLLINNKPMIQHVYEQSLKSDAIQVIVATDDQQIVDAVKAFGGEVCMTATEHLSGTDRIQEVVQQYQLDDEHIVVNVQGDEPCIPPAVINQVANNLRINTQAAAATLSEKIINGDDFLNPNVVKVVANQQQMALYFSRAPIPFPRDVTITPKLEELSDLPQRHIGIYAYRVSLLHRFIEWPPAPLEKMESLEQLRLLFYGEKMHVEEACQAVPGGVDTAEDLERVRLCQ
ncbi:MAG: 3-deoxy-manno-octulosonate cytidylyltransferase (CMP-KDO synthetase) [Candidatus Endobugula sp.]|jgi:3-deoxy-manno-octulosonate cytidylyltransferase (CMP-KDO synthetase)